jgi:hypothetical protein
LDPFATSGSTVWVSPTNRLAHNVIDNLEDGFRFERNDGAKLFREHNKVASLGVREAVAAHGSPDHFQNGMPDFEPFERRIWTWGC